MFVGEGRISIVDVSAATWVCAIAVWMAASAGLGEQADISKNNAINAIIVARCMFSPPYLGNRWPYVDRVLLM